MLRTSQARVHQAYIHVTSLDAGRRNIITSQARVHQAVSRRRIPSLPRRSTFQKLPQTDTAQQLDTARVPQTDTAQQIDTARVPQIDTAQPLFQRPPGGVSRRVSRRDGSRRRARRAHAYVIGDRA
jgi:hypothetical protein